MSWTLWYLPQFWANDNCFAGSLKYERYMKSIALISSKYYPYVNQLNLSQLNGASCYSFICYFLLVICAFFNIW